MNGVDGSRYIPGKEKAESPKWGPPVEGLMKLNCDHDVHSQFEYVIVESTDSLQVVNGFKGAEFYPSNAHTVEDCKSVTSVFSFLNVKFVDREASMDAWLLCCLCSLIFQLFMVGRIPAEIELYLTFQLICAWLLFKLLL